MCNCSDMWRWEKPFNGHHSFFICNHLSLSACSCNSLVYTKFMCDSTNLQHRCSHSHDYCISFACRYKHFSIWKWYIPVLQSLSLCLNVGTLCLILRRLLRAALIGTAKAIAFTNAGAGGCTRRSQPCRGTARWFCWSNQQTHSAVKGAAVGGDWGQQYISWWH